MATRNQNILSLSALGALLLLLVLVLLNVAASRVRVRVDLTEEGLYTLADGTRSVLTSIEDPATIKVFWHKVQESFEGQRRDIESLLDEMQAVAGDRLTIRWVDLDSEDGLREAEDAGVEKLSIQTVDGDEISAVEGYAGLVIEVEDQKEVISNALSLGPQLEYELTSRIARMTQDRPVVGLVAPQPASNPFMGGAPSGRFTVLAGSALRQSFGNSARTSISLEEPVAPDVKALIVAAPEKMSEKEVFHLEQYLLGGGRVLLLLDPVHARVGEAPAPEPVESGFEDWLAHLGLTIESGVVGDYASMLPRLVMGETARGRRPEGLRNYPYWPLLLREGLDASNPAIRLFDQIPMFWPQAISIDVAKNEAAGRKATVLASTTERGYRRADLLGLDRANDKVTLEDLSVIPIAATLEGKFVSFWKGRKTPIEEEEAAAKEAAAVDEVAENEGAPDGEPAAAGEGSPDGEPAAEGDEAPAPDEVMDEIVDVEGDAAGGPPRIDEGEGFLIVMTDAEMVSDTPLRLMQQLGGLGGPVFQVGYPFVLSLAEWMTGSDELLQLRARTSAPRQIEKVEPQKQKLITWLNILVVPLLVLFVGIVVWLVRRYQR